MMKFKPTFTKSVDYKGLDIDIPLNINYLWCNGYVLYGSEDKPEWDGQFQCWDNDADSHQPVILGVLTEHSLTNKESFQEMENIDY